MTKPQEYVFVKGKVSVTMYDKSWGSRRVELETVRKLANNSSARTRADAHWLNRHPKQESQGSCLWVRLLLFAFWLEFEGGGVVTGTISVTGGWRQELRHTLEAHSPEFGDGLHVFPVVRADGWGLNWKRGESRVTSQSSWVELLYGLRWHLWKWGRLEKVWVKYKHLSFGNAEFGMPAESYWWRWPKPIAGCSSSKRGQGGDHDFCEPWTPTCCYSAVSVRNGIYVQNTWFHRSTLDLEHNYLKAGSSCIRLYQGLIWDCEEVVHVAKKYEIKSPKIRDFDLAPSLKTLCN